MKRVKMFKDGEANEDVYLKLSSSEHGVVLQAVNRNGDRVFKGSILRINNSGTLKIFGSLQVEGLQVDDKGHILVRFER